MTVGKAGKDAAIPRGLAALMEQAGKPAPARPVERWNPEHCGAIDMMIRRDGTWLYNGSAVTREALVRLFASILRREPDGSFVLVTPVEKMTLGVEDAPFVAVEMSVEGTGAAQKLTFRTNVGDIVTAGPDHPLRFDSDAKGGWKPYVMVRRGLEALLTRPVAFELADLMIDREGRPAVMSNGEVFTIGG